MLGTILGAIGDFLAGLFRALLGKPIKNSEEFNDVGHEDPKNPDDIFDDTDW